MKRLSEWLLKYWPVISTLTAMIIGALAWSHVHAKEAIETADTAQMKAIKAVDDASTKSLQLAVEQQQKYNRKSEAELKIMQAQYQIDRLRKKGKTLILDDDDKDLLRHQLKLRDIYRERLIDAEKQSE